MRESLREYSLYLAWGTALAAVGGSLYFSEIRGIVPCLLCWYQRILMFPLLFILTVGILRKAKDVHWYVLPLSVTGALVAVYHNLLQIGIIPKKIAPCTAGVSCATRQIVFSNFVTIPILSLIAFLIITASVLIYGKKPNQ